MPDTANPTQSPSDPLDVARAWVADQERCEELDAKYAAAHDRGGFCEETKAILLSADFDLCYEIDRRSKGESRAIIPALIAEVKRLRSEVAGLERGFAWLVDQINGSRM
jgi:hypothetical protein